MEEFEIVVASFDAEDGAGDGTAEGRDGIADVGTDVEDGEVRIFGGDGFGEAGDVGAVVWERMLDARELGVWGQEEGVTVELEWDGWVGHVGAGLRRKFVGV